PMLMKVIGTRRLTSRSWGRLICGAAARAAPLASRRRARPSEKYAASAPVRRAEQATRNAGPRSLRASTSAIRLLARGAGRRRPAARGDPAVWGLRPRRGWARSPREVLEAGGQGGRASLRGEEFHRPGRGDLADDGEGGRRRGLRERCRPHGDEQLVVLPAAGRPRGRVDGDARRRGVGRVVDREPRQLDPPADPAPPRG